MRDRGPGAAVCRLAVVGAMLLAASGLTQEAAAADKVVVAWPSAINIGLAPITFAQELGYFKKEDIELDVVVLTGSGAFIPQLLNGQIFTVLGTPEPLVISRQPGKPNFDFRFIHNYQRNSMWEIAVLEQGDIRSIKDLAGKSIGVGGL